LIISLANAKDKRLTCCWSGFSIMPGFTYSASVAKRREEVGGQFMINIGPDARYAANERNDVLQLDVDWQSSPIHPTFTGGLQIMAAQTSDAPSATAGSSPGRTAAVNLPFVGRQVRIPRVRAPHLPTPRLAAPRLPSLPPVGRREFGYAARGVASYLPPRRELVYYTGLGVLTAIEVLEWPVAVAVAAGTAVARRSARDERRAERRQQAKAAEPRELEASEAPEDTAPKSRAGARQTRRSTSGK
jgi:hypothetical protein